MLSLGVSTYSPVLRLKKAEYSSFSDLVPDLLPRLLPNFVIPPPKETDVELGRELTASELVALPGARLGQHWPFRPCMLDPRALYRRLGRDDAKDWLPALFKMAMAANAMPILVADLRTIESSAYEGIRTVVRSHTGNLALRVTSDDLVRSDTRTRIQTALLKLTLKPSDCVLILDFENADLSDVDVAAEIIVAQIQEMMGVGLWGQIIWQATTFPEKNPAIAGTLKLLPRQEWQVWRIVTDHDPDIRKAVMFGDFAADCSKFSFGSGGGVPIPHYRYSTPTHWLVSRGEVNAKQSVAMKNAAVRIVGSGHFAGVTFSKADRLIHHISTGGSCGNSTTWRQVNIVHHLTRVTSDIGGLRGYTVSTVPMDPPTEQLVLF